MIRRYSALVMESPTAALFSLLLLLSFTTTTAQPGTEHAAMCYSTAKKMLIRKKKCCNFFLVTIKIFLRLFVQTFKQLYFYKCQNKYFVSNDKRVK
jgi:hypothetical protein